MPQKNFVFLGKSKQQLPSYSKYEWTLLFEWKLEN